MKRSYSYFLVAGIVMALAFGNLSAQSVKLQKWVIGSGGMVGAVNSDNVHMSGICGQLAIEKISNTVNGSTLNVYQGFWTPQGVETGVNDAVNPRLSDLVNYPNPFSTSTVIKYTLPGASRVVVNIYDQAGSRIKVLFDGIQNGGAQQLTWDAKDMSGVSVSSGTYMYELVIAPADLAGPIARTSTVRSSMVVVK